MQRTRVRAAQGDAATTACVSQLAETVHARRRRRLAPKMLDARVVPNQRENSSAPGDGSAVVEALECRIGRARFAVPTNAIARIVEYHTLPLPLAKPWIGGISLYEDAPLISVALRRPTERAGQPLAVKGILLNVPASPVGWALEVDEVFVFVRAQLVEGAAIPNAKVPRWINVTHTAEGRSLGFVNVGAMVADLADVDAGDDLAAQR